MNSNPMDAMLEQALAIGFSHAASLDIATLKPLKEVRAMCAAGKCGLYGKCWTCPPGCGSLEENATEMRSYSQGMVVQTTGKLEDDFDYEGMENTSRHHKERFASLYKTLKLQNANMLALGAGGCWLCDTCTYPDEPCRMPEEALSSMEAYGLLVSDVCIKNNLGYYYGPGTITYTSCYLWR